MQAPKQRQDFLSQPSREQIHWLLLPALLLLLFVELVGGIAHRPA